jgi:hypothetical protein
MFVPRFPRGCSLAIGIGYPGPRVLPGRSPLRVEGPCASVCELTGTDPSIVSTVVGLVPPPEARGGTGLWTREKHLQRAPSDC